MSARPPKQKVFRAPTGSLTPEEQDYQKNCAFDPNCDCGPGCTYCSYTPFVLAMCALKRLFGYPATKQRVFR